jgi:selenocysteine lyase/cysteine desulfurase
MINQLGGANIASYLGELTAHLLTGLMRLRVEIVTRVEPEHRSGIVTFSLGSRERNLALMEYLLERKVLISVRYTSGVGGVRISSHFYNTKEDLDRTLEHVQNFLRS